MHWALLCALPFALWLGFKIFNAMLEDNGFAPSSEGAKEDRRRKKRLKAMEEDREYN